MIEFRFPLILYIYIPLFLVLIFLIFKNRSKPELGQISKEVRSRLLANTDLIRIKTKDRLFFLSLIFLIFAASGPQIGVRLAPLDRKGIDLVFALDVSTSMNAEDVKPSRLEKAKFEISQMIQQLKGARVAIIVFAGSSHMYLPLTTDYDAALLFLNAIDTDIIPTQGTSLSSAMSTAISAFTEESDKFKVMLLVTDGEDHEGQAIELAEKASEIILNSNKI